MAPVARREKAPVVAKAAPAPSSPASCLERSLFGRSGGLGSFGDGHEMSMWVILWWLMMVGD